MTWILRGFLLLSLYILYNSPEVESSPAKAITKSKYRVPQKPIPTSAKADSGDDEADEIAPGLGDFASEFKFSSELFSGFSRPSSAEKPKRQQQKLKVKHGSSAYYTPKNRKKWTKQIDVTDEDEDSSEESKETTPAPPSPSPAPPPSTVTPVPVPVTFPTNPTVPPTPDVSLPSVPSVPSEVPSIPSEAPTLPSTSTFASTTSTTPAPTPPSITTKEIPESLKDELNDGALEPEESETTTLNPFIDEEGNPIDTFIKQGRASCQCGRNGFRLAGTNSRINEMPWTAAIVKDRIFVGGRPHCAGSLINDLYVITSANCVDGFSLGRMEVWLTAHDSLEESQRISNGNIKRAIDKVIMHPNYSRRDQDNDIALLRLEKPIDISSGSFFVPICLPAANQDYAGVQAKIMAWSSVSQGFNQRITNPRICKTDIPVIKNDVCNRDTRHSGKVTDNMMCAGYLSYNGDETCLGDAGGPLVMPNGGRSTLIGVISWGYDRNYHNRNDPNPTVFSRVAGYADWILHNTRDADWCNI